MSLLITEIAINAAGEIAIELTNTAATPYDLTYHSLFLGGTGVSYSGFSFAAAGVSSPLAPNETITLGHSNIPGLDYSPNDAVFERADFANVFVQYFRDTLEFPDSVGVRASGGPVFGTDIVYTCDTSRTPDTDPSSGDNRGDFIVTTPFSTNTLGSPTLACFAEGTGIATPSGEVAVEDLRIGDPVLTAEGRAVPIVWIGRQTIVKRFFGERASLVRIAEGALGNQSDLFVTGDHGMVLEGYVINASVLVNGGSIDWVPLSETPARFTVYHVETEAHDTILANGAVAETFVDYDTRRRFDNYADYLALAGEDRAIAESPLPRISAARHLPASLRERLLAA